MRIIFVGDAHLKGEGGAEERDMTRFLNGLEGVDTLVVLGDLFDFWTGGNAEARVRYRSVLRALKGVSERGTSIVYVEGNHDFSMGRFFTRVLGARIVTDGETVELDGRSFYLTHGDRVNMTGGYRLWRWFLRSPLFTVLKLAVPSRLVWSTALGLSRRSRSYDTRGPALERGQMEFARRRAAEGADYVVMGHSHMAGVHDLGGGTYANPGGWEGGRTYLEYEDGVMRVRRFAPQP